MTSTLVDISPFSVLKKEYKEKIKAKDYLKMEKEI